MSNQAAVIETVKTFTGSFPKGNIDIQEAFSSACDVAFSLVLTIAGTVGMDDEIAINDFIRAINRRAADYRLGKLSEFKSS